VLPKSDTIAAIATAPGRGGIGVVRISGSNLGNVTSGILGVLPEPRKATLTQFYDVTGEVIDQGIAIYFPAPHSYTGENVLELQGHGGPAILQLLLQRCLNLGSRLAQPGEFTQRAYLNNKLDLAQAESVADLINSSTAQAAKSAMRSLLGDFSKIIYELLAQLIDLRMLVEAMLDFPEEELEQLDVSRRESKLNIIKSKLVSTLELAHQGSLLREGAHVALIGQPNVGKSSLLNCLSGEDIALVSEIPGTTRDIIRQSIQLKGIPLHIIDTAGLREAVDIVERLGIERTRSTIAKVDVILFMLDAKFGFTDEDKKILLELPEATPHIFIVNKIDINKNGTGFDCLNEQDCVFLSAKTGEGIPILKDKLLSLIGWHQEAGVFMARERHVRALQQALEHTVNASKVISRAEIFAEELRLAQVSLNSITGEFTSDDLLGEIFSRFCIGK
jgi:tRNA modification GTPase